jgi:uncharacterized membrane protein YadS
MKRLNDRSLAGAWIAGAVLFAFATSSPAIALIAATVIALSFGNPVRAVTGKTAKYALQAAVVLLGFGLQPDVLFRVGASSILLTLGSIVLLSSGTAICGGSAIAAVAPAIGASHAHTAVALAVVFVLNAVALLLFPPIGQALGMTQEAFGLWAAIAIHDTSSVVGAAAVFGAQALAVGTTVKLTRALWIFPLSFLAARFTGTTSSARFPWFLVGFVLAAIARGYVPAPENLYDALSSTGRHVMVGTLFLIGAGLTRDDLRRIGAKPLAAAVLLWLLVSALSLAGIQMGWLRL